MAPAIRSRLSLLMFLHFFSLGAVIPVFSLYAVKVLGFSGAEIGTILAAGSLATTLTPLLAAPLADRWIRGRSLLGILSLASGVFFFFLLFQRDYWGVFLGYVLLMGAKGPTFALANSLTFQHIEDRQRHFPLIRLWGTVGWIAVGWFLSLSWLLGHAAGGFAFALVLGAAASLILGLYAWTLPRTLLFRPDRESGEERETNRETKSWDLNLVVFLGVSVFVSMADKFFFFGAGIHGDQLGVPEAWILPVLSVGQVVEVLAMAAMGRILPRLGFRRTFLLGILWQVIRFTLLSWSGHWELFVLGVGFHGLCFSFFFSNAYVYMDHRTAPARRAAVHQLYIFLVEGVGVVAGNYVAGWDAQFFQRPWGIDFGGFWLVPAGIALICLITMALFFKERSRKTGGPT